MTASFFGLQTVSFFELLNIAYDHFISSLILGGIEWCHSNVLGRLPPILIHIFDPPEHDSNQILKVRNRQSIPYFR